MKNNLPRKWSIYNDGSQQFKNTVEKFLREKFQRTVFSEGLWYSYSYLEDGSTELNIGLSPKNFHTPLALDEFIELTGGDKCIGYALARPACKRQAEEILGKSIYGMLAEASWNVFRDAGLAHWFEPVYSY